MAADGHLGYTKMAITSRQLGFLVSVVTVLDRQKSVGFGRYYGKKTAVSVSVLRTVIELLKLSYKFYNNGAYLLPLPAVKIRRLTRTQILGSVHL